MPTRVLRSSFGVKACQIVGLKVIIRPYFNEECLRQWYAFLLATKQPKVFTNTIIELQLLNHAFSCKRKRCKAVWPLISKNGVLQKNEITPFQKG